MSSSYKFPQGLYEDEITYVNAFSLFQFFIQSNQTNEFFKYLYSRIKSEYDNANKGAFIQVLANDNQRVGLIDLNYNFFIEVLGEWVEHYSKNKSIKTKYRKFSFEKSKDDKKKINKCREFAIELTVKERLQFDFSYSGWLIGHKYKRGLRFKLVQVFLNNMLGGYTYVRNYKWHNKAMVTNIYLVKNLTTNKYVKFVGVSFLKSKLFEHFGQEKMKVLEKMTKDYDAIVSTSIGVKNHMKELKLSDEDVSFYDGFDIKSIEENRDEGDGIFHFIEAKKDEKNSEESDVNLDEINEDEE